MDISVLQELKDFEKKQETLLEEKKKDFLKGLESKKKGLLERNEMELYELASDRQSMMKNARAKAKKHAMDTINSFKEKTKKLASSEGRIEEAVNLIFSEFLRQNV